MLFLGIFSKIETNIIFIKSFVSYYIIIKLYPMVNITYIIHIISGDIHLYIEKIKKI